MKFSIVLPFKNDYELINDVVENIIATAESDDYEIIVYNDGSVHSSGRPRTLELDYKNTRVINASQSFGVGYAFDRCVEQAKGDILILQGSDVYAHKGWHTKVLDAVKSNPTTIGCAVCVGDKEPFRKYYGADLLIKMGNDDLPLHSKLRERKGGYTDLFRGKWSEKRGNGGINEGLSEGTNEGINNPYEISCLMGAFYWTTKEWYRHIGGWDTEKGNRYCGHSTWGHLEPHLSMKSYLCGGNCVLYPDIEVTHLFNRVDRHNRGSKGTRGADAMHWNAQWIVETMVLNGLRRNMLQDFMNPELNLNVARQMIKRNMTTVERYRERNRQKFKFGLEIFETKFGIKL
jgi:glycosyltransferase involved in cell wall biosynthesis